MPSKPRNSVCECGHASAAVTGHGARGGLALDTDAQAAGHPRAAVRIRGAREKVADNVVDGRGHALDGQVARRRVVLHTQVSAGPPAILALGVGAVAAAIGVVLGL